MVTHLDHQCYQAPATLLPARCPWCDDEVRLIHLHPGPPIHLLQCRNPRCTYERDYDTALHALLERQSERLNFCVAQIAWLTCQLEELRTRDALGEHLMPIEAELAQLRRVLVQRGVQS